MTPQHAAKILDLPADATPEQIETRFQDLRAKLEDKIAKAPTPGLKGKYRESLDDITAAFEALTLAADASALPMLNRQSALSDQPSTGGPASLRAAPAPSAPALKPKRSSGGLQFAIVVVIALAVLGGGAWWVMKTRAEEAEKARLATELAQKAAEQKAEAERAATAATQRAEEEKARLAAAAHAEQARREQQGLRLRARLSELGITFDALLKSEAKAERDLAELKSEERFLARDAKGTLTPELKAAQAFVAVHERYTGWLQEYLAANPARLTRARLEELASARAWDDVAGEIDAYATAVSQMQAEIAARRDDQLTLTGVLQVTTEPAEVDFTVTDIFGRVRPGRTPAEFTDLPLGNATVSFQRTGWLPQTRPTVIRRDTPASVSGDLVGGTLALASRPFPVDYVLEGPGGQVKGRTPANLAEFPPGEYRIAYAREGWPAQTTTVVLPRGGRAEHEAVFVAPSSLKVETQPAGATITRAGQVIGTTPLLLSELPPGEVSLELTLAAYRPVTLKGVMEPGRELALTATLRSAQLTPEEAFDKFSRDLAGVWLTPHGGMGRNVNHYFKFVAGSTDFQWRMSLMKQNLRMVEYDAHNNTITAQFKGVMAMGVKIRLQLRGDVLSASYSSGENMDFRRVADSAW